MQADLPSPIAPSLHPVTKKPLQKEDLSAIFASALIAQENSPERYIEIPEEIRQLYAAYRPSPLSRATALEKLLDTPAKIYYKYEGQNPAGSHKMNTALAQAYYNKLEGIKRLATETGAGQWGCALSIAANLFDIECAVYMVRVSYEQKPYRRSFMECYGASVIPSPSYLTEAGRSVLRPDPASNGSLGIAISEAVEDALSREDTNYCLGSVLNHVALHQTIIGEEALRQMAKAGDFPDVVIGCHGGGSNFAGISFPFMREKLSGRKVRIIASEPSACPTLTRGVYAYDYADNAMLTPITMMYTLGSNFMPPGIHSGGLRYHGASPIVSKLHHEGLMKARSYTQNQSFEAALTFARAENILPAPESSFAIKAAIDEALAAKEAGESRTILFCLSGNGLFDLSAYDAYRAGQLKDISYDEGLLRESLSALPKVEND